MDSKKDNNLNDLKLPNHPVLEYKKQNYRNITRKIYIKQKTIYSRRN